MKNMGLQSILNQFPLTAKNLSKKELDDFINQKLELHFFPGFLKIKKVPLEIQQLAQWEGIWQSLIDLPIKPTEYLVLNPSVHFITLGCDLKILNKVKGNWVLYSYLGSKHSYQLSLEQVKIINNILENLKFRPEDFKDNQDFTGLVEAGILPRVSSTIFSGKS